MKLDIPQALQNLDWACSEADQAEARNYLVTHIGDDLSSLMLGGLGKPQFENAARVLVEIGRPRVEAHIPQLLEWLMDMNWPGAFRISALLQGVDEGILIPHVMQAIQQAQNEDDDIWVEYLENFHKMVIKSKATAGRV